MRLEVVYGRGEVTILERPTQENDFALIVEFNDEDSGSDWYEVVIVAEALYTRAAAPQTTTSGMRRGAAVSGTVTDADTGRPVPNIGIHAENGNDRGTDANAETNARGRYVLRGLAPGSYVIMAGSED